MCLMNIQSSKDKSEDTRLDQSYEIVQKIVKNVVQEIFRDKNIVTGQKMF